jgi:hypothetical protein
MGKHVVYQMPTVMWISTGKGENLFILIRDKDAVLKVVTFV